MQKKNGTSMLDKYRGIPETVSIAAAIALHLWKRQMLISIEGGTVCDILLVQFVF